MEATVRDKAVREEETQATVVRSLSIADVSPAAPAVQFDDIARRVSDESPGMKRVVRPSAKSKRGRSIARNLALLARKIATIGIVVVAVLVALVTWDEYNSAPWTRDGSVRVQVANIAPQISGQIKELRVVDNQFVHKGDILYVIDPLDFEIALRSNKASLLQKMADHDVKELQAERRRRLTDLSTSTEEKQIYDGNALQAKAVVDSAQQLLAQAEINLKRTEVRSPVNGVVTNLLLREGNYAQVGSANISVIDTDSYWIDGYFEETKLARLCVGDRVEAKLMGYSSPVIGHITTVTRGVAVSNAAVATQGLPNVEPVYSWVRLAQRVPIRIAIDKVPPGVSLVSGLTATVTIRNARHGEGATLLQRARADVEESFVGLFGGDPARPGCIPNPS